MRKNTLKRVLSYAGKYPLSLVGSIFFALLSVIATLFIPVLFGDAIDCIVSAGQVDFVGLKSVLFNAGAVVCVSALAQWLTSLCNNRISANVVRDLKSKKNCL